MRKYNITLSPAKRRQIISLAKKHHIGSVRLFGSFARGEANRKSDIDLLVELKQDFSLLDFIGLKLAVEKALNAKVDLVEYGAVKPALAKQITMGEVSLL